MVKMATNPFLVSGYAGPSTFCDRKTETDTLVEAMVNKRNVTLFSLRRMGKTGLADHVGYQLKRRHKYQYLYSDIYHTYDSRSLLTELSSTLAKLIAANETNLAKLAEIFKSIRPVISFDPISGAPQIELNVHNENETFKSFEDVFDYLDSLGRPTCWVIDEFQQISTYENADQIYKLLRRIVQRCRHINFIFSGSHPNMLLTIFKKSTQPFYNSTQLLELNEIPNPEYRRFINGQFKKGGKHITENSVSFILEKTKGHTWYVQMVCNRLFQDYQEVDVRDVTEVLSRICTEQEIMFYRYRQLISKGQWNLLKAIALEGSVSQITASKFINVHNLTGSASTLRALKKLLKDEFIVETYQEGRMSYRLNDIFLMIWIQTKYRKRIY